MPRKRDINNLADEKNPLYDDTIDIKAILRHPKAQQVLSSAGLDVELANMTSDEYNNAIQRMKEDGAAGHHDPDYAEEAFEAMQRHDAGDFDEFKNHKVMEFLEGDEVDADMDIKDDGGENAEDDYHPRKRAKMTRQLERQASKSKSSSSPSDAADQQSDHHDTSDRTTPPELCAQDNSTQVKDSTEVNPSTGDDAA